ncbi:hypothetical protein [Brevibacterium litoralis]|uniref:hypothetical protein n=1 Tax=Brevibacterium litoralis TaxID=3138935 RepID=UPI0032F099D8
MGDDRSAAARRAIESYKRTLRNESGGAEEPDGDAGRGASSDAAYLADRPPHWAPPTVAGRFRSTARNERNGRKDEDRGSDRGS